MPRLFVAAVGVLFASLTPACYETPKPACAFLCGEGGACPDGYECGGDNRCHLVLDNGNLAECPDPLPVDADTTMIDAEIDMAEVDMADVDMMIDAEPDAAAPDAEPDAAVPDAEPDAEIPDAEPDAEIPDAEPDAEM